VNPSIAYLNGQFLPLNEATISPLDRGFLFADGVYEVIPVYNGHLFELSRHLDRLTNSLSAVSLDGGLTTAEWETLLQELVTRNSGGNLSVYLQITRGAPELRDHNPLPAAPTVFAMVSALKSSTLAFLHQGIAAVTLPDIRWQACHIKSIALLPNVMARQQAQQQGSADAILVRDDYVTEGTASNVFIIRDDTLFTPPLDQRILPGITRQLIVDIAVAQGIVCRQQDIPAAWLETAQEIWLTSSTREIVPVTQLNGGPVGTGTPGPLWRRMMELYQDYKTKNCPSPLTVH
jgi:D-alanine transaminase